MYVSQVDKFQAILALGTQGGVPETYLTYLYESVGNVPDVNPKKVGFKSLYIKFTMQNQNIGSRQKPSCAFTEEG